MEALAKELYDIGAAEAECVGGQEKWRFDEANHAQRAAATAIARHVLKKFEGKTYPVPDDGFYRELNT